MNSIYRILGGVHIMNKTVETDASVIDFLETIDDDKKRQDCFKLLEFFNQITKWPPKMWGESIIGFGKYHYRYASGREGDFLVVGFSPRKGKISIYMPRYLEHYPKRLKALGKLKHGKVCIYLKNIEDIDLDALEEFVMTSIKDLDEQPNFNVYQ